MLLLGEFVRRAAFPAKWRNKPRAKSSWLLWQLSAYTDRGVWSAHAALMNPPTVFSPAQGRSRARECFGRAICLLTLAEADSCFFEAS